jgi:hypothetical protein
MAHLIPSLDMALLSATKNRSRLAELVLQVDRQPFLHGAYIYHRVESQPELQSPALLGRFDLVIIFPGRGIVCVCPGNDDGRVSERLDSLQERYPQWSDVAFIFYDKPVDSEFWDDVQNRYALMKVNPDLQSVQGVCHLLDQLMGIVELPPCFASAQDEWLDTRFVRVVKQSEVQRNVIEQLTRWTHAGGLRLRVDGRAGSGKTLTALMLYRKWVNEGRKPLLLCYNHRLGLWLYYQTQGLPGFAGTLFHWARMQLVQHGQNPPANAHHISLLMEAIGSGRIALSNMDKYDCLIVDEGQDFQQAWAQVLFDHYLLEGSNLVWFEDSHQKILSQDAPVSIDNVSHHTSVQNLRTPKHIARYGNQVLHRIAARLGIDGDIPEIADDNLPGWPVRVHTFEDASVAVQLLHERIDALITEGVPKNNILVLSGMSDSSGMLMSHEMVLGRRHYSFRADPVRLKRYIGEYDLTTNEKHYLPDDGVYCDSIHKVKGLEEYVVLLMDVMPPALPCSMADGSDYLNRLYCSFTRSKARMEVFVEGNNPLAECFAELPSC